MKVGPISRFDRRQKLLGDLDIPNMSGLEIGPLASPIVRESEGRIRYVDHANQATLRAKYSVDLNVKSEDIVPVHAIWGEKTLPECFPGETFDYVIASHVMEHVPNVIEWLKEVASTLRPEGQLILALPDRRYTFDVKRRPTELADWIDRYLRGVRRPTPADVFDTNENSVDFDHVKAWSPKPTQAPAHFANREWALREAEKSLAGKYIDVHCSVFDARRLLVLLDGLLELHLMEFRLNRFHIAPFGSAEMTLILTRQPLDPDYGAARRAIRSLLVSGTDSEGLPLDMPRNTAPSKDAQIAELKNALAAIRQSTSWKLTAPMRTAMRLLRKPAAM